MLFIWNYDTSKCDSVLPHYSHLGRRNGLRDWLYRNLAGCLISELETASRYEKGNTCGSVVSWSKMPAELPKASSRTLQTMRIGYGTAPMSGRSDMHYPTCGGFERLRVLTGCRHR